MNNRAKTPPLDIDDVRRRLGEDDEWIAMLLQLFVENCPAQVATIRAAVVAGDSVGVRRSAHALKGSAANLSAADLVAAAKALEDAAVRTEVAGFDRRFAVLVDEVERLVTALNFMREGK